MTHYSRTERTTIHRRLADIARQDPGIRRAIDEIAAIDAAAHAYVVALDAEARANAATAILERDA